MDSLADEETLTDRDRHYTEGNRLMLRRLVRTAILLSAAFALPSRPSRADDPLPKAETVLDQYVEATGGKGAYEKVKNRAAKGTIEIVGANLKGTFRATEAAPNKSLEQVDITGQDKISSGTDGTVAWEVSETQGPRVIVGEERADKLREAAFNDEIRWKEIYDKAECTGVEDVDGKPAYKVVLTPKSGKPVTEYYDKSTHLLVKILSTNVSPLGEISVEVIPADYKKVDGVLIPHKLTAKYATLEMVIVLDEIKHNVDLPADTFKAPEAVKELLDKKKAGE